MDSAGAQHRNTSRYDVQWMYVIFMIGCVLRQCLVMCELISEPPGCLFPDFLQSSDRGMGDWTWKYDSDIHVGKVFGGVYTICSNQYSKHAGDSEDSCLESQMRRKCVQQYGPDLFAVQHEEHRPTYQCIKFIQRGPAVVQLAVSDRHIKAEGICNRKFCCQL